MNHTPNHRAPGGTAAQGQSLVEFLVALAVLLPLFLAVTYAGRYGDIQQSAVQASRYAAFQRALQPNRNTLSDATLQDQMRARFFVHGRFMNNGRIQSDDTAANLNQNSNSSPALWRDLSLDPMLRAPSSVNLTFGNVPLAAGALDTVLDTMASSAGKTFTGGTVARVEMTLVNRMSLADNATPTLSIGAATAAAGDNLSSSGGAATRAAAVRAVPTARFIPQGLADVLEMAMQLFEPDGPEFGCMRPDPVASHRLEGNGNAPGGCR